MREGRVSKRTRACAIELALVITRVVLTCVMTWAISIIFFAQQPSQKTGADLPQMAPEVGPPQTADAPVEIDGRPVLLIYSSVAGISPEERAANIEKRILGIAGRNAVAVESIRAEEPRRLDGNHCRQRRDHVDYEERCESRRAAAPLKLVPNMRRSSPDGNNVPPGTYLEGLAARDTLQPDCHRSLRACLAGAFPHPPSHPTSAGQTGSERSAS